MSLKPAKFLFSYRRCKRKEACFQTNLFNSVSVFIWKHYHAKNAPCLRNNSFCKILVIGFLVRWNWGQVGSGSSSGDSEDGSGSGRDGFVSRSGQVMPSLYQAREVLRTKLWFDLWIQIWPGVRSSVWPPDQKKMLGVRKTQRAKMAKSNFQFC